MTTILNELRWRDLVFDFTDGIEDLLAGEPVTLYNGFDPTADSLHIGHMVPLLGLARFQRFGYTPIAVAGGGTGMIGDPSGKAEERQLLTKAQVDANVAAIKGQLARFLDFEAQSNPARVVNNADWLLSIPLVDFLRDTGKHFTVGYMLAKDSVRSRLEGESGMSFTEFSYMLLQSYDYLHLYQQDGCLLQTGGSDQWGNITAGVELIRRVKREKVHGLVYPLVTRADGTKFGKTETGTVWLDPERTSPYRFYQFWLNTEDQDAIKYLKYFTWLSQREIEDLQAILEQSPERREPQRVLAREVTRLVHGEGALAKAEQASEVLFGGEMTGLNSEEIADIFAEVPSSEVPKNELAGRGLTIVDLLDRTGLVPSKSQARRLVDSGGIYLNNRQVQEVDRSVTMEDSLEGRFIILRRGRKTYHLVRLEG
jgi:tyrosyl-tRNA synthetase